jgi:hypothetical protein
MPRITKRSVDAATPDTKDAYLWDDELKGFGLKTTPAGKKVYLVQYRIGGRKGRVRRVTIGAHGTVTPEQARTLKPASCWARLHPERDPAAERDNRKADTTLGALLERFLAEHADAKLKTQFMRANTGASLACIFSPAFAIVASMTLRAMTLPSCITPCATSPIRRTVALPCFPSSSTGRKSTVSGPTGPTPAVMSRSSKRQKRERFLSEIEIVRLSDTLHRGRNQRYRLPLDCSAQSGCCCSLERGTRKFSRSRWELGGFR